MFFALESCSTYNETLKFLMQFPFDLNEVYVDNITNLNLFLLAVMKNNIEFVRYLLSKNKSLINSVDLENRSGLYIACENNNYEMVKLLINENIDISLLKDNKYHPLIPAFDYNIYEINRDEYNKYMNMFDVSSDHPKILAQIQETEDNWFLSNKNIIDLLLKKESLKYIENIEDLILYATENNNLEAFESLFSKNIKFNINEKVTHDSTLLDISIEYLNKILSDISVKSLYDYVKKRDMERNDKIIKLLLQKRPNKITITSAKKTAQKISKLNITKKLEEYKN